MAEPADVNLDELRRRGRRRLVGAIVLALVAAVVVPMLLESDPRPLGEDVSVRIPPVDDGKFVPKLDAPKAAPAAEPAATPAAAPAVPETPRKSLAEAEKSVLGPGRAAIPEGKAPAAPPPPPPAMAEPAKAEPARVAPPTPAKGEPAKAASPAKDAYVVQLGAFTDDKGANALAGRLARAGHPAYVEPLETSRGKIWRVRVGPYPSRDAAVQARDKLKLDGHAGIVVQPR